MEEIFHSGKDNYSIDHISFKNCHWCSLLLPNSCIATVMVIHTFKSLIVLKTALNKMIPPTSVSQKLCVPGEVWTEQALLFYKSDIRPTIVHTLLPVYKLIVAGHICLTFCTGLCNSFLCSGYTQWLNVRHPHTVYPWL